MISEFAKEKVFWTRKMNIKLVKFIESRPNIWNPKHPKYTSVPYRDRTYAEFASKYGNEFTSQAVKDRWTNIRSTFANYLRKFNASLAKGDREEFKVNWHLWNPCKFLLKVNKKNIKSINLTENSINGNEFEDLNHDEADDTDCIDETQSANKLTCNNMVQNLVTAFQNIQDGANQNCKYSEVGRMVARKLSEMNSYEAAITVNKITEILLLYEDSTVIDSNNIKSEIM